MSWSRALAYLVVAAVLATAYFTTAPPPPPSLASAAAPTPGTGPSAPVPTIDSIRLEAGGRTVRAVRDGEQWVVVEPAGAAIPSDLLSALVSAVLETPAEPVTADAKRLADFGLDAPSARLTFGRPSAAPVTLLLGSPNPAETGVYGCLDGNPQIVLVGLNVRYYLDLVLRKSSS